MQEPEQFSVLDSLVAPAEIARLMKARFGMSEIDESILYLRGIHDTYRVSTPSEQFAVRVYRHGTREPQAVEDEIGILLKLAASGASVAAPVPRSDGQYVASISAPEGIRSCTVFRWVPGRWIDYRNPSEVSSFAEAAARLHDALDGISVPRSRSRLDPQTLLREPLKRIFAATPSAPDLGYFETIAARLEALISKPQDFGLCHGDLHGGNANISGDNVVFYDFDFCGPGERAYDLGTVHWALRIRNQHSVAWQGFLEAYQGTRPLACDHSRIVAYTMIRHIWLMGLNLQRAQLIGAPPDNYLKDSAAFLKKLEEELSASA